MERRPAPGLSRMLPIASVLIAVCLLTVPLIRRTETPARNGFTSGSIRSPWVGGCVMPEQTIGYVTVTDPKMIEAIEKEFEKQREEALTDDVEQREWIDSRLPRSRTIPNPLRSDRR